MSRRASLLRAFAATAASIGWGALILQFCLSLRLSVANGQGVGAGIVSYFGFFTILTNILAALTLSTPLVARSSSLGRFFSHPSVISAVAAAMALVSVVYSLLLRNTWNPQGWERTADATLHDVMPALFLIYWWLAVPKGAVQWGDIPRWLAYPVGSLLYVLVRGKLIGLYPYSFMDVGTLGYARVFANGMVLILGFTSIAVGLVGISAWKRSPAQ